MGVTCDLNKNKYKKRKNENNTNHTTKIPLTTANQVTRAYENNTNHANIIPVNIINQISKSICKITYIKNGVFIQGTGFFMIIING